MSQQFELALKPSVSSSGHHHSKKRVRREELTSKDLAFLVPGSLLALYGLTRGGVKVFHSVRRQQLRQLLFDAASAMNDSGLTWWLDFGALLGIYRDGDLIPHDNDIDLIVLDPDWDRLYEHLAARFGPGAVHFVRPSEDPSIRWIRVHVGLGAMLDVFGGYLRGTHRERLGEMIEVDSGRGDAWWIPRDLVFGAEKAGVGAGAGAVQGLSLALDGALEVDCEGEGAARASLGEVQYRNHILKVPAALEAALVWRYGDTWMVPRYMDKGRDTHEQHKLYARIFTFLGNRLGIRL